MTAERKREGAPAAALLLLWAMAVVVWWGFAFFPAPPADDSWIAAAQSACFGSIPGGLPAAHGWIMLALAPLLLLTVLMAILGGETRPALDALVRRGLPRAGAFVLVALFAAELVWAGVRVRREVRIARVAFAPGAREPMPDGWPRLDRTVPPFALVDQAGRPFTSADLPGQPTVLSFVFAHCTTVCPVLMSTVDRAARTIGPDRVRIALVTLDPWRDTPSALPSLAARFGLPAGAHLLSGPPDDVCRLLDTLQVARERDLRTGDVSHAPVVMVLDARGRIAYVFNNPAADWIVEGVRRVREAS